MPTTPTKRWIAAVALIAVTALASGCIRSRLRITTDPRGSVVKINDVVRGKSPVEAPFVWYWYYTIDVEKEGYEPVRRIERLRAPWWGFFPLDLAAELIPYPIPDTRRYHIVLQPASHL